MMKKYFWLLVCILFVQCDDQQSPDVHKFPRMKTISIKVAPGSAIYYGEFLVAGKSAVLDHGFVWAEDFPDLESDSTISLGAMAAPGKFNATVNAGLTKGIYYSVRAYAVTSDYVVYGETVSFTAQ